MPEFRFSLGQKRGPDLVTNGDFSAGATGWTLDAGWAVAAGQANHVVPTDNIKQVGIFELGKRYSVDYEVVAAATGDVVPRIGDYGLKGIDAIGTYTHEAVCLGSTDLVFNAALSISIDNIAAFEIIFNDPLSDQPKNWEASSIVVERQGDIDSIVSKYITDLVFIGDGYDFLLAEYLANGACAEVPVKIEYRCNDTDAFEVFDQFPEGVIYINNCKFDQQKCEVTTSIEDRSAATLLQKAKDTKVFIAGDFHIISRGLNENASARTLVDFHDSTGARPATYANKECYNVGDVFRFIILSATNLQMDFRSDFFTTGGWINFSICMGLVISRDSQVYSDARDFENGDEASFSFKQFFEEMNKIFSLEILPTKDGNEPVIKIEPKQDFLSIASGIILNNVVNPKFQVNNADFFKTIHIGYEKTNESDAVKGQKQAQGLTYTVEDSCEDKVLDLVNKKFIQSSDLILRLMSEQDIISSGTQTSRSVGSLQDAGANFIADGVAKDMEVVNETTGQRAIATAVAATSIALSDDIFPNNDIYAVYNSIAKNERDAYWFEWFIIQVETVALETEIGPGNSYNADTDADDNMTRWVENLQADALSQRGSGSGEDIIKTNPVLARVFDFDHPMSLTTFQQFTTFAESIAFNSPENGIPTDITGYIKRAEWKVLSGATSWELKTE